MTAEQEESGAALVASTVTLWQATCAEHGWSGAEYEDNMWAAMAERNAHNRKKHA